MKKFAVYSLMIIGLQFGCQHDPIISIEPDPCQIPLSYQIDILPLIQETCNYSGCHDGAYNDYEGIEPKLQSGKLVDRVFHRMNDPVLRMPPSKTVYPNVIREHLTQEELDLLQCWINQGYPR
ncbi:MAG: hypothetical protein K9I85_07110 [Saprospiraceae bacterium]|nr:hypothetical protein [Saprospiraceae bacterium]